MKIILGPFHPHLETALVDEILKYKKDAPLCALLVLVPSDSLRRRLKVLLTRERKLSFVNLQLLTFHQLSAKLFAEANGLAAPTLRSDLFLEEVLRRMIRAQHVGTEAFAGIDKRAGGCAALWQSLRDLRDGMVQPATALEALREGHFDVRTRERTANLLILLDALRRFCAERRIEDHSELDKLAIASVAEADFLRRFAQIFYYGFYDLTQLQVDLFHAVAQNYSTTLFFPLVQLQPAHEGWTFAERFYQRYVQGRYGADNPRNLLIEETEQPLTFRLFDQEPQRSYRPLPANWRCRILNTFGIHDEISAAAKEILRLAGDDGMAFDEIGVVARTLDAYGATIKEVFARHQIPIAGVVEEPLTQFPLTKTAILLLNLPAKDYLRSHVIDLLSSPYFRLNACGADADDLRPDLWDLATRELAICRGMKEWSKLDDYTTKGMELYQISDDDERRAVKIPAAQLGALATILNRLSHALSRLPEQASWHDYARSWKDLFEKYLGIRFDSAPDSGGADTLVGNQIVDTLDQIAGLDNVQPEVSLGEFSETFQRWLERGAIVATDKNLPGVTVANATAARGLGFRALFVVGMNEGVFPRTIREDAFLRDCDREVLERDLGYKVGQKLAAFDEEKLVFTLLVNAAWERLYCSFQRADESGRVLAPSWYLADLKRALGADNKQISEETIPRSVTNKPASRPFDREELLLPDELAIRLSLAGRDSTALIEAAQLSANLYQQGLKSIARIDLSTERLSEFDGVVATLDRHRRHIAERGLSPTGLELYARCPFQYFARRVLGLERLETPEEGMGPSVSEFGELGHSILKLTYQELIRLGYFTRKASNTTVDAVLTMAAQKAFVAYEENNPIGYPLMWETLRETLIQLLREVVQRDLQELAESGYVPVDFETEIADRLPAHWPAPLNGLPIRGRMDRIDVDPIRKRMRIVDYKFKFGAKPSAQDNDLTRAAMRGQRLQPPLYSVLGQAKREKAEPQGAATDVEASFYFIASRWNGGPLVTQSFSAADLSGKIGSEITRTISQLAGGIQSGLFFMQRGDYCAYCEIAEICRKNHPPSLWRTENDPLTAPHRALRKRDPAKS